MEKPIYSTRGDDADFDDAIGEFVAGLGERVDALQDAEAADDREAVRRLAADFASEAEAVGYPAIAAAAREVGLACEEEPSEALRKQIVDLTTLAQRVRRGHRSSA